MKHIKLLSALTLSAALLTAASGAVSAAVVDKTTNQAIEKTDGSAGFIVDKTQVIDPQIPGGGGSNPNPTNPDSSTDVDTTVKVSDLALYSHPKEFNFGIGKISAADKVKTTVTLTQKNGLVPTMMRLGLM